MGKKNNSPCCGNCHQRNHVMKYCPFKFCLFCLTNDYETTNHYCDRNYVLLKFVSISLYQNYVRSILDGSENQYENVLSRLKEERPSFNIGTKEFSEWFFKIPYITMDIRKYANGHVFKDSDKNWEVPFVIQNIDGLEMKIDKNQNFEINDFIKEIGEETILNVIDVSNQEHIQMKANEFLQEWQNPTRGKILNSLSSGIGSKNKFFQLPEFVRDLAWTTTKDKCPSDSDDYLSYAQLCMKNGLTLFHADYSGTSTILYLYKGEKTIYIVEKNERTLKAYLNWDQEVTSTPFMLPEFSSAIKKFVLKEGELLYLPGGWIHAVHSKTDCIALSFNFIHSYNIESQTIFHKFDLQHESITALPDFELRSCYACYRHFCKYLNNMQEIIKNEEVKIIKGFKMLLPHLLEWITDAKMKHKKNVESCLKKLQSFFDTIDKASEMNI